MIMEQVIAWSGFAGAWLLVAGPILQASIELQEETVERESITELMHSIAPPPPVSRWWWLLPPVGFVLQRRRTGRYRDQVMKAMPHDQLEQLIRFGDKATGWAIVAFGAFFIAGKETWELHELYDWPVAIFWVLTVVMAVAAAFYTVVRQRHSQDALGLQRPGVGRAEQG